MKFFIFTTLITLITPTPLSHTESYLTIALPPAPPSLDYRDLNCVTKVKDQGPVCDNCWAFSAISTLESHLCLKSGKLVTLSEQQLIDCDRGDFFCNWGCSGGVQSAAYRYISECGGIESDVTYPYEIINSVTHTFACKFNKSRVAAKVSGYRRIKSRNEEYLRDVVAEFGPVSASLNGDLESFKKYKSGIYDDENCGPGKSHAVEIIGYGSENGTVRKFLKNFRWIKKIVKIMKFQDFWICKNSW
jgi:C1A family cysteine protease